MNYSSGVNGQKIGKNMKYSKNVCETGGFNDVFRYGIRVPYTNAYIFHLKKWSRWKWFWKYQEHYYSREKGQLEIL
jgi:hypothetical protein